MLLQLRECRVILGTLNMQKQAWPHPSKVRKSHSWDIEDLSFSILWVWLGMAGASGLKTKSGVLCGALEVYFNKNNILIKIIQHALPTIL